MNRTIELRRVVAGYVPRVDVLRDVSLTIEPGLTQLTGSNGSGKSTLLAVMAGALRPRQGEARLGGEPVHSPAAWKSRAVCRAAVTLFPGLTVAEHAALLRYAGSLEPERIAHRFTDYGLAPWLDVPVGELSTGNLRKAWIVLSTAAERRILLFDEPFSGLDEQGVGMLTSEIFGWKSSGRTVVLVSHQREEGLGVDRIVNVDQLNRKAV